MHSHVRLPLAALAATVVLTAAVATASAGRLSVSNGQFRAIWSTLELSNSASEGTVRCPLTVEGSFHSATISKTTGAKIGVATRAVVGNSVCTGGRASIDQETAPWAITYQSFTGTLPNITGVTFGLIRGSFVVATGGNTCRATFTVAAPAREIGSIGAGGAITSIRADESAAFALTNGPGGLFCNAASGIFRGTGSLTLLGNTNAISIRLI